MSVMQFGRHTGLKNQFLRVRLPPDTPSFARLGKLAKPVALRLTVSGFDSPVSHQVVPRLPMVRLTVSKAVIGGSNPSWGAKFNVGDAEAVRGGSLQNCS